MNPDGETVWELKPSDLPEYRFTESSPARAWTTAIRSSAPAAAGDGPQLVEVTPDKKVVWVLKDWAHFGPATAVQILDDPGVPENPGESGH